MSLNHYVPNFILKNFAHESNGLSILDKLDDRCFLDKGGGGSYDNAFAEHSYNPIHVEEVLSRIESNASPHVKKLIDSARCGEYAVLDAAEKGNLCTFLLVQSLRIPSVQNWVMKNQWELERDKDVLWQMFKDLCENKYPVGLESEKLNEELTEHPYLEKIIWLRMMDMNINVGTVKADPGTFLLIGDVPCLMKGYLAKQGDVLTMPLAKDVYIELSRPESSAGRWFELSNDDVHDLNVQTYSKACRFVAGACRDLLRRTRTRAAQT